MSKYVAEPHFFVYENKEVREVSENEYYQWTSTNWHPGHLQHTGVKGSQDEVVFGFQGHYKFCEWQGKPFNITYFVYGNEIHWLEVYDEYYATYEEAEARFNSLAENGYLPSVSFKMLQAA